MDWEWLRLRYRKITEAFWFLPALIVAIHLALAFLLVAIDDRAGESGVGFAFGGGAAAARSILSAIASSVITVAGLTFSIMIVTLQLVSAQYTPRALRTFLDDRITQVVAGTFVGIFGYSLLVLREVRGGEASEIDVFVPSLAVSVAIVLGLIALGLLIVFVHHMSVSIQVSTIAARLADETLKNVDRLYPAERGEPRSEDADAVLESWRVEGEPGVVRPPRPGFVQTIDLEPLVRLAKRLRLRLHVAATPGEFVTPYTTLVEVWPETAAEAVRETADDAVLIADERDLRDDVGFGVRQLADIALRALSPGVNDPTTAHTCIGYLRSILEALASRPLPDEVRDVGNVVLVAERPPFSTYVGTAFTEVAASAAAQPRVAVTIAEALAAIAGVARGAGLDEHARACERMVAEIDELLLADAPTERGRARLREAFARAEESYAPTDRGALRTPTED